MSKYDVQLAHDTLEWIAKTGGLDINTDGSMENFIQVLKDGVVLCKSVLSHSSLVAGRVVWGHRYGTQPCIPPTYASVANPHL